MCINVYQSAICNCELNILASVQKWYPLGNEWKISTQPKFCGYDTSKIIVFFFFLLFSLNYFLTRWFQWLLFLSVLFLLTRIRQNDHPKLKDPSPDGFLDDCPEEIIATTNGRATVSQHRNNFSIAIMFHQKHSSFREKNDDEWTWELEKMKNAPTL